MTSAIANADVRAYLDAVASHLEDLSPEDRDELLDDLEQHLLEVAAEGEGTLHDRLGSPEAYAEELRASTGLAADEDATVIRFADRWRRSWAGRTVRSVRASAPARALRSAAPELRPAWWVLRGIALVWVLSLFVTEGDGRRGIIPVLGASMEAALLSAVVAIGLSYKLGRLTRAGQKRRGMSLLVNGLGLLGVLVMATSNSHPAAYYQDEAGYYVVADYDTLRHADGSRISNICPYASDGTLLSDVLLFDQDGRQIVNTFQPEVYYDDYGTPRSLPSTSSEFPNAYPKRQYIAGDDGEVHGFACPSVRGSASKAPKSPRTTSPTTKARTKP